MMIAELKQFDLLQNLEDLIGRSVTYMDVTVAEGVADVVGML